ncbi:MAG: hypothetical protein ACKVP3_19005 [Hyphomicrobiaceae bacterium]
MQTRAQKIRRIVRAQEQLKLAEEWRLRSLDGQLADAEVCERELLTSLGTDNALHGLFLDATVRRLRTVAEEVERIRKQRERQSRKLLASATRLKSAELLSAAAERDSRREIEKKELLDLIEQLVDRSDASLP